MGNFNQWMHSLQGMATMVLWPAYNFLQPKEQPGQERPAQEQPAHEPLDQEEGGEPETQTQIEGEAPQESESMSEKTKTRLRYVQSGALTLAGVGYPVYNFIKRVLKGAGGYYNKVGETSFIFQDGSFWTNSVDGLIGTGAGLAAVAALYFYFQALSTESRGQGSGCRKAAFATILGVVALVHGTGILMGGLTMGNHAGR